VPERYLIGVGCSVGFLVVAFFAAGFHEEIRWRLKQRRYGGYLR